MAHHTKDKGDLGNLKAQVRFAEEGWMVLNPNTEHAPFDFVAYKDKAFVRVQVKYKKVVKGSIPVCFRTCWSDKNGTHIKHYDLSEIDVMAIYCPDTDKCYFFKPNPEMKAFTIRVDENSKFNKVKMHKASDLLKIPD